MIIYPKLYYHNRTETILPKRSNEYQRLVLAINQHLASSNATVTESKMLWDPLSEQDREIDIFIEDNSGPYKVTIGIECTAKSRPIGVPAMEQLITKHKNVGIQKTVIVSKSGFAVSAKKYAKKMQIDAISFGQALTQSWPSYLNKAKNLHLILKSTTIDNIEFDVTFLEDAEKVEFSLKTRVLLENNESIFISDYVYSLLQNSPSYMLNDEKRFDEISCKNKLKFKEEWKFNPKITLIDENGIKASCSKLIAECSLVNSTSPKTLTYEEFNGKSIAYGAINGQGENNDTDIAVTASGDENKVSMTFKINSPSGLNLGLTE